MSRYEIDELVKNAKADLRAVKDLNLFSGTILVGNLRDCYPWVLKEFKRELQDFNAVTGEWKS